MPGPFGKEGGRALRSLGALSTVGIALVLAVLIGTALGYAADRWLGTSPWGFLVGFLIGVVAGMRSVFRTVAAVSRHERE